MTGLKASALQVKLNGLADLYGKDHYTQDSCKIFFLALSGFSEQEVDRAMAEHVKSSSFMPRPADLLKHLQGDQDISTDRVISEARNVSSPFGVLCRIHIGSFDLDSCSDHFYLKSRAQECIDKLFEWKRKDEKGDYSDHELKMMIKHKINPSKMSLMGQPKARNDVFCLRFHGLYKAVMKEKEGAENEKLLIESMTAQEKQNNKERVSELIKNVFGA